MQSSARVLTHSEWIQHKLYSALRARVLTPVAEKIRQWTKTESKDILTLLVQTIPRIGKRRLNHHSVAIENIHQREDEKGRAVEIAIVSAEDAVGLGTGSARGVARGTGIGIVTGTGGGAVTGEEAEEESGGATVPTLTTKTVGENGVVGIASGRLGGHPR